MGYVFSTHAQSVGIKSDSTTPDNSAMLDVKSANKGLLIPQIALTGVTNVIKIPNPAVSLLVYNTSSSTGLTPGYYYWSGALWTKLTTPVADGSETKVTAGTNVTITGTGTTASPYVVGAIPSLTQEQRDALTPSEGLMIYNSTSKKPNFYNGTEWRNYDGTSAQALAVGVSYQGGVIAYILQSGDPGYIEGEQHGLIAAPSDQSIAMQWYNGSFTITRATATAIGTGNANTNTIVTSQGAGSYAAKLCSDLVLGGYSDWYLPSIDELNKLYLNKDAIGGFSDELYWSSTEVDSEIAWKQWFDGSGAQVQFYKGNTENVRAIRAF